jgi:6-phosphogluconolactonase (cycloisomerase 2 family)
MRRIVGALVISLLLASCGGGGGTDTPSYSIGGSLSGLTAGGLMLSNGGETLTVAAGSGQFRFPSTRPQGASYNIGLQSQPLGLACAIQRSSGTIGSADVSDISVVCSPSVYSVGGSIDGLHSTGLMLNNGRESLLIAAGASEYSLPSSVSGSAYGIAIQSQPFGETCSLSSTTGAAQPNTQSRVDLFCQAHMVYAASDISNRLDLFSILGSGVLSAADSVHIDTEFYPRRLMTSPDGRHLYVAAAGSDVIDEFTIATDGGLAAASQVDMATGGIPTGIAIAPDGKHAYVSSARSGSIWMYAVRAGGGLSPMSTVSIPAGRGTYGLAVTLDGKWLYAANANDATISMFSIGLDGLLTPLSVPSVSTGSTPYNIVISPLGQYAYSINYGAGSVRTFAIQPDGSLARIPGFDVSTGSDGPTDIVFSADGRNAYVSNFNGNSIAQYSIGVDGVLTPLTPFILSVAGGPATMAISADGKSMYVGSVELASSYFISVFSIGTNGSLAQTAVAVTSTAARPYHLLAR